MTIRITRFRGQIPRSDDDELKAEYASEAVNCEFWSGKIRPWKALLAISATVQSAVKSIWQFADNDSWFFEWTTDVDVVKGDLAQDTEERTYYTGDGAPKVTSSSLALTGTPYPDDYYTLGVPIPAAAPSVTPQENTGAVSAVSNVITTGSSATIVADGDGNSVLVRCEFEWTAPIDEADLGNIPPNSYVEVFIKSTTDNLQIGDRIRFPQGQTTHARASGIIESEHSPADGDHTYELVIVKSGFLTDVASITTYAWTVKRAGDFTATLSPGHNLEFGDRVTFTDIEGMTQINNENFEVTEVNGNLVTLSGAIEGALSGSGTWTQYWAEEDLESRSYIVAFVAELAGKEMIGPPSDPSDLYDVGQGQPILIDSLPAIPVYDTNWLELRIYRLGVGSTGAAEFFYVDKIGITAGVYDLTSYTDSFRAVDLGDQYIAADWIPPPADLSGIVKFGDGHIVGFRKNELHFSEQFQFHAFPSAYVKPLSDEIVSIGTFGESVAVSTKGEPYIFTGRDPLTMSRRKLELAQACVSKRGSIDLGYGFLYPSNDGMVLVSSARAELVTRSLFTIREWRALNPASFLSCRYDDRLMVFYDNGVTQGGFIMDPKEPELGITFTDVFATAAYCDPDTGDLYLVVDDVIEKWDSDAAGLTFRWRSKRFTLDAPVSYAVAKVVASFYPVQFRLWASDVLEADVQVDDSEAFRVDTERELFYQLEVESTAGKVDRIYLAETMAALERLQR